MNEQKIQMMPTVTQPVKKGLEKMYPVPYMGIGQRTRNAIALFVMLVTECKISGVQERTYMKTVTKDAILNALFSFRRSSSDSVRSWFRSSSRCASRSSPDA